GGGLQPKRSGSREKLLYLLASSLAIVLRRPLDKNSRLVLKMEARRDTRVPYADAPRALMPTSRPSGNAPGATSINRHRRAPIPRPNSGFARVRRYWTWDQRGGLSRLAKAYRLRKHAAGLLQHITKLFGHAFVEFQRPSFLHSCR